MFTYQILRPFGYLSISHPAKKVVDWYIPICLAALLCITVFIFRTSVNVWGENGLVAMVQGLVQGLPGFYIAALAAVATFGKQSILDTLIPEPTPTIDTWYGGGKLEIELTRRRFLSLLFAYLTAISLCLSIFSAFVRALANPIRNWFPEIISNFCYFVITYAYVFFVLQMLIVTLWGLYYLSDKMHQPDANSVSKNVDQD